ncbi:uncharacterized protein B0H18DRAFT_993859 [Fomitopsis serialis]|uniref:uncharacterized protein n=1 Tax=Fomitopsis serialis TaxID=139415 RepID=UPI0020089C89|nr:uncharacterized protein B0H18DRAFT_993859 [Neoantrodia serialis]KAH9930225.1 hypothetical protein B0H18DRAFT_993859 [Neoantrodia serialis]
MGRWLRSRDESVVGCAGWFSSLAAPFRHSPSIPSLLTASSPPFSAPPPPSSASPATVHTSATMSDGLPPPSRRRHGRSSSAAIIDVRSIQRSQSYPRPGSSGGQSALVQDLAADTPGASTSRMAASRIVSTMWRPFSTKQKRDQSPMDSGMYSTPEESRPPMPSPYSVRDAPRPTIQQIAMGLHVSRTPHLRSPRTTSPPSSPRGRSGSQPISSYKRVGMHTPSRSTPSTNSASRTPSTSDLSLTGSTLTMSAPPTPSARSHRAASVSIFPTRLQMRLDGFRSLRADDESMTSMSSEASPRKTVRFSSSPVVPQSQAEVTS